MLLIVFCFGSTVAWAEFYKFTDKNGKFSFADRPRSAEDSGTEDSGTEDSGGVVDEASLPLVNGAADVKIKSKPVQPNTRQATGAPARKKRSKPAVSCDKLRADSELLSRATDCKRLSGKFGSYVAVVDGDGKDYKLIAREIPQETKKDHWSAMWLEKKSRR
ncbi:MAG: hypothetical protein ACI8Z1_001475 [Candidatus Azotimanducaceae bacterium]|jgi:hypothetical protein